MPGSQCLPSSLSPGGGLYTLVLLPSCLPFSPPEFSKQSLRRVLFIAVDGAGHSGVLALVALHCLRVTSHTFVDTHRLLISTMHNLCTAATIDYLFVCFINKFTSEFMNES